MGLKHPIRFAVIGDRTGGHEPGVYAGIIREIELLQPDFTMTVGDMIEGFIGDTAEVRREWEEYQTLLEPLSNPIHHTPGNHDIWGESDNPSLQLYHTFVGEPFYSFDYDRAHFIVLDNSRHEKVEDWAQEQLDWLKKDLKKNLKAAYTLVFFHKPFWYETVARGKPDALHDIFVENGVDAVFTGHYHIYFSGEYDGIVYTSMGSSGGGTDGDPTGVKYHFAWVTLTDDGVGIALIKKGSVLPWDNMTADDWITIDKIQRKAPSDAEPVMVAGDQSVKGAVYAFTLNNPSDESGMNDTLRWTVPAGWTVEPAMLPIDLAAGESRTLEFTVSCNGALYPVPKFSIDFPYREGRTFPIERPVLLTRTLACYRADAAPTIDGDVSDAAWRDPVTALYPPEEGNPASEPVEFYFAGDADNLYLAAVCHESDMDGIAATVTDRDGPVYGEDCVGYFFAPNGQTGLNYQIYFNPNGAAFDQKITLNEEGVPIGADREWNGEYEVKTARSDGFWSIEARISLASLEIQDAGKEWRINFRRKQKRLNTSSDWQVPISYEPATCGVMKFGK